ncbi:hypothetical protein NPIL_329131 [Nephila pilipes]|uniref:Uncharacterized protein n=1 Tax=Nephila pilipes TaxID=299642 RepID=A0A8X6QCN0_NEPPI|nr:hypothetical protein NPIL_329131 [Nephila pilipes]
MPQATTTPAPPLVWDMTVPSTLLVLRAPTCEPFCLPLRFGCRDACRTTDSGDEKISVTATVWAVFFGSSVVVPGGAGHVELRRGYATIAAAATPVK